MRWGDAETVGYASNDARCFERAADKRCIGLKIYDITASNRDSLLARSTGWTLAVVWYGRNSASWNKSPLHVVGDSRKTSTSRQRRLNLTLTFDRLITVTHTHTHSHCVVLSQICRLTVNRVAFSWFLTFLAAQRYDNVCQSVCLSVCHACESRRNGWSYRNML